MVIFDKEYRTSQRKNLVKYIFDILDNTQCPNKIWAFIIKSLHFTLPIYLFFFVFILASKNLCIFCYLFLVFFLLLYIYLQGCFISSLEYKLYSKNFINIIDPYIMLFNYKITNDNRFYGTFTIAFTYFLVVSIVLFYRFQKKIE